MNFKLNGKSYRDIFYIMPKRGDETVIIGRDWMTEKKKEIYNAQNLTIEDTLTKLFKNKNTAIKNVECEINTEPGKRIFDAQYKIPQAYEKGVEEEINRLLRKGYIRESKSTWLNDVRPVLKKNGSIRLATNLIKLNKIVEQDTYTIPRMNETIYKIGEEKIFSKLDLKEGFFQIALREEDRMKTAFRIKIRTYEWNRMPMGFKNSTSVFQRAMDKILEGEIGKCCFVYIDDILIFSKIEEDHEDDLLRIFNKLVEAGLTANKEKVELRRKNV